MDSDPGRNSADGANPAPRVPGSAVQCWFGLRRMEFELCYFMSEVSNRLSIASELRDAIEQRFCTGDIVIPLLRQVIASGRCIE